MTLTEFQKTNVRKQIEKGLKYNSDYLEEQSRAYDEEYALQMSAGILFFPEDKIELVRELRDYLFELKEICN